MSTSKTLPDQRLFIGGQFVEALSRASFETVNPATGEVICRVASAGPADVARAVSSAEAGFATWSAMTGAERGRVMMRAAALLRARNRELAELEVLDTGKPIQEAEAVDVLSGADCIEYYAGLAASLAGQLGDVACPYS
jgi:betaine-aldehyde dehydrogenase